MTNAGNYKTDGKTFLKFAAKNGYVHITDMQLEGKKRIPIADFLRGYRFADHS
jgi:methionyl-tRNA formyltransferase